MFWIAEWKKKQFFSTMSSPIVAESSFETNTVMYLIKLKNYFHVEF